MRTQQVRAVGRRHVNQSTRLSSVCAPSCGGQLAASSPPGKPRPLCEQLWPQRSRFRAKRDNNRAERIGAEPQRVNGKSGCATAAPRGGRKLSSAARRSRWTAHLPRRQPRLSKLVRCATLEASRQHTCERLTNWLFVCNVAQNILSLSLSLCVLPPKLAFSVWRRNSVLDWPLQFVWRR